MDKELVDVGPNPGEGLAKVLRHVERVVGVGASLMNEEPRTSSSLCLCHVSGT